MTERVDVLEAIARETSARLRSAQVSLDRAQGLYDAAHDAHDRACAALGAAIEEEDA